MKKTDKKTESIFIAGSIHPPIQRGVEFLKFLQKRGVLIFQIVVLVKLGDCVKNCLMRLFLTVLQVFVCVWECCIKVEYEKPHSGLNTGCFSHQ